MADEFGNWTVGVDWDLTGFNKSAAHVEKVLRKLATIQGRATPASLGGTSAAAAGAVSKAQNRELRLFKENTRLIKVRDDAQKLGIETGRKAASNNLASMQKQNAELTRLINKRRSLNAATADKGRAASAEKAKVEAALAQSSRERVASERVAARLAAKELATKRALARTAKATAAEGEAWLLRKQRLDFEIFSIESKISSKVKETHREYATLVAQARQLRAASLQAKDAKGLRAYREQMFALKTSVTATTNEIARQNRAMNSQKFAANSLTSSMHNLARSYISVFAAIEGGRAFFRTAVELDSIKASLIAVSADADQAAADFEFLKSTSLELGVGLSTLSDGYRKIGIGARAANINLEDTREILLSGAEAATAFGLDAEQANLVLLAMGQIISKGRVSREELGRQMGEQFPAMIIGAEAMNMELAEFERLVESGGLSAKEFIVPFAKELRATVRETGALQAGLESVRAEIGRFQGQMQIAVDEVFSGGMRESTALIIKQLTAVLTTYAPIIKTLGAAIVGLTIAVSGILNGIGKVFAPLFEGLNIIIGKVAELLGLVSGDGDSLVTGFETLGVVIGIVAAIWGASSLVTGVGWLVTKGLPAMISLWETVRILMLEISILNAFATSGASIALGAAALAGVGLVAAIGVNSLYGGSDDSGATTTSTDKSTNTTIERLEVNVTAPAGADANQFGQHVADSMAASMGLSSAITN